MPPALPAALRVEVEGDAAAGVLVPQQGAAETGVSVVDAVAVVAAVAPDGGVGVEGGRLVDPLGVFASPQHKGLQEGPLVGGAGQGQAGIAMFGSERVSPQKSACYSMTACDLTSSGSLASLLHRSPPSTRSQTFCRRAPGRRPCRDTSAVSIWGKKASLLSFLNMAHYIQQLLPLRI